MRQLSDLPLGCTLQMQPIRVHKGLVAKWLDAHPETLKDFFPDGPWATAEEAVKALREHPATWIVDGVLSADDPRCMGAG